ncbi:MAG: DUF1566 domain-containing protein [Planctomycetia bacterium]|nr:DUF1566 domain-containing protein [Planctomycetia bacterium]
MRTAIFLFLVLMHCSTLFAYEVKVTKLTDENFVPITREEDVLCMGSIEEYQSNYKDKQIATITLRFLVNEIGRDQDAVNLLAAKEAAKLGANTIFWVSGTVYKDTKEIASSTYRCIRDATRYLIDFGYRPKQYTENKFEVQKDGKVIYDKATGLMWQQSGSEEFIKYDETKDYIRQLNREDFAGYNDWRLPTLREAITLLKPEKSKDDLFIDSVFNSKRQVLILWIWTSDLFDASSAWFVDFSQGGYYYYNYFFCKYYVRAVR